MVCDKWNELPFKKKKRPVLRLHRDTPSVGNFGNSFICLKNKSMLFAVINIPPG